MNKEIKYLLNEMKDTTQDYIGTNGCKYQDLLREELNLLLSYIEQLENNRDKAIEYLEQHDWRKLENENTYISSTYLLSILKGDSDDK